MSQENMTDWQIEKACTDIGDYELSIEKQKTDWQCEQNHNSWKWVVSYHGSIVASGSVAEPEEAKILAIKNCPQK